jgi:hypothetical protein
MARVEAGDWAGLQALNDKVRPLDKLTSIPKGGSLYNQRTGETVEGSNTAQSVTPLLADLDPEGQQRALAAYNASGGGDAGVKAITKEVDRYNENKRLGNVSTTIETLYPDADPQQLKQLQLAAGLLGDTKSALKTASDLYEVQQREGKAKQVADKAFAIVKRLVDLKGGGGLNDVVGPIEGRTDFRFDGEEANVIADIRELKALMTVDNMKLMTGVLSESDIQILGMVDGGGLDRTRDETRFNDRLVELQSVLAKAAGVSIGGGVEVGSGTVMRFDAQGNQIQ